MAASNTQFWRWRSEVNRDTVPHNPTEKGSTAGSGEEGIAPLSARVTVPDAMRLRRRADRGVVHIVEKGGSACQTTVFL